MRPPNITTVTKDGDMATDASEKMQHTLSETAGGEENAQSSIPARRLIRLKRLEASITALERMVRREIDAGRVPGDRVLDPLAKLTYTWKLLADQVEKDEKAKAKRSPAAPRAETPAEYLARKRREKGAA
jgi:hypothetical protein